MRIATIKIHLLHNDIVFDVALTDKKKEKIEIKSGVYQGKQYVNAIITNNSLLLEGDMENVVVISNSCIAIYITVKSIIERIADIMQDESVYISKMNAISEGKEREILEQLIVSHAPPMRIAK